MSWVPFRIWKIGDREWRFEIKPLVIAAIVIFGIMIWSRFS
jgi:hypothetical protein